MGFFGETLGGLLGGLGSKVLPIPGINGAELGRAMGGILPFKRGGRVKRRTPPRTKSGRFRKRK